MSSLAFPILLFSSISLHRSPRKAFLSLLAIHWNSFKWCIFPLLLCLSLLFSAICKASSDNHFAFFHFFFLGSVLITASCTMSQTSIHSSSSTLSIRSNPLNLFVTSTVWSKGIWFRSYLNGLVVFPTFFNLSLNFARRSSWSEPQSAPVLVFAACIELGQAYRTSMCRPRIWTQVCVNQTPGSYHSFSSLPLIVPCWWEWQAYDAPILTWGWTSEWELGEMGCHVTCQRLACSFFSGREVSCHTKLNRVKTWPFFLNLSCLHFISWPWLLFPCNLGRVIKSSSLPYSSQVKSTGRFSLWVANLLRILYLITFQSCPPPPRYPPSMKWMF